MGLPVRKALLVRPESLGPQVLPGLKACLGLQARLVRPGRKARQDLRETKGQQGLRALKAIRLRVRPGRKARPDLLLWLPGQQAQLARRVTLETRVQLEFKARLDLPEIPAPLAPRVDRPALREPP